MAITLKRSPEISHADQTFNPVKPALLNIQGSQDSFASQKSGDLPEETLTSGQALLKYKSENYLLRRIRDTLKLRPPEFEEALKKADALEVYKTRNPLSYKIQDLIGIKTEKYEKASNVPLQMTDHFLEADRSSEGHSMAKMEETSEQALRKKLSPWLQEATIKQLEIVAAPEEIIQGLKDLEAAKKPISPATPKTEQKIGIFDDVKEAVLRAANKGKFDSLSDATTLEGLNLAYQALRISFLGEPWRDLLFDAYHKRREEIPREQKRLLDTLTTATTKQKLVAAYEKIQSNQSIDPEFEEIATKTYNQAFNKFNKLKL